MTRVSFLVRFHAISAHAFALCLALGAAVCAHAGAPAAPDTLRLEALIAESLRANPELAAARDAWRAAEAGVSAAGALEDPILGFMLDDQPVSGAGEGRREVSLSQAIPFPGKRGLMSQEAAHDAALARAFARGVVRRLIAEVKAAYFDLFMLEAKLATLRESQSALDEVVAGARVRYEVGTGAQQDLLLAMVEASSLKGEILHVEALAGSGRAKLNLLLDREAGAPLGHAWVDSLSPFEATLPDLLDAARASSPAVLAREREVDTATVAHRLARIAYRPDFMLSGAYMQVPRETDEWRAEAALSIPLWKARKQDAIAHAAGRRLNAARYDLDAERNRASAAVEEQFAHTTSEREIVELYRREILPQAELAYKSARSNYLAGREMFLILIEAHRKRIELRNAYYEYFADSEMHLASLEEAVGKDLSRIQFDIDAILEADPTEEERP
ncbi:MAG: TolC family protein [bacterium]